MTALSEVLVEFADMVAARVVTRLRDADAEWFDQSGSPLGGRRHIAATKRRIAKGAGGAAHIDRRWLLSKDALAEELANLTKTASKALKTETVAQELERELRLVRGSR